jgi:hypothetical protein
MAEAEAPPLPVVQRNGRAHQLGVGGLVALGVLYVVFQFLLDFGVVQRRVSDPGLLPSEVSRALHQLDTLYQWHDRRDLNGIPLWYVPRTIGDSMDEQITVLRDLVQIHRDQTRVLERMDRREERRLSTDKRQGG